MPDPWFAYITGPHRDTADEAEADWDRIIEILRSHAPDLFPVTAVTGGGEVWFSNGRPAPGGAALKLRARG